MKNGHKSTEEVFAPKMTGDVRRKRPGPKTNANRGHASIGFSIPKKSPPGIFPSDCRDFERQAKNEGLPEALKDFCG